MAALYGGRRPVAGAPYDVHQTLGKAIHWSYSLLDPAEQQLFRRVAIFGGCPFEAAERV